MSRQPTTDWLALNLLHYERALVSHWSLFSSCSLLHFNICAMCFVALRCHWMKVAISCASIMETQMVLYHFLSHARSAREPFLELLCLFAWSRTILDLKDIHSKLVMFSAFCIFIFRSYSSVSVSNPLLCSFHCIISFCWQQMSYIIT